MADSANIHQAGIQINFKNWERFDLEALTNDGVVLFQYLVFHCQSNAEWTHSDNSPRAELGIKRSRITALRTKFIDMGILDTRIVKDRNDNDIRAYRLNFTELTKLPVLRQIYREASTTGEPYNLGECAEVFKALAITQPKLGSVKSKAEQMKLSEIKQLAARMKGTFDSRRKDYNDEVKKKASGAKRTASGTIEFSPNHLRKLENAVKAIGNKDFIHDAFIVYCDAINYGSTGVKHNDFDQMLPTNPRSPLNYFLSYSTGGLGGNASFGVIYTFGEYFSSHYGKGG